MASPGLSNKLTSPSLNSLRRSLSSVSSFHATSSHTGEEIPLSENIRYNRGEGEVVINCNNTNENSIQIPRRKSSSLQQLQSQPPNGDNDEGLFIINYLNLNINILILTRIF
jgi:hypothetical protein